MPLLEVLKGLRKDPRFSGTKIIVGGPLFESKQARTCLVDGATEKNRAAHVSTDLSDALEYLDSLNP